MPGVKAKVKGELLAWAREEAGLSVDDAARKIGTTSERLTDWESDKDRPTINQLRKAAEVYKRPLAVFYLSEIPRRFRVVQDFRRMPGVVAGIYSPRLRVELREAAHKRELALDLARDLGEEPPGFSLRADLRNDAEEVAATIRSALGVRWEDQQQWRNSRVAFNNWRDRVEGAWVLVFQAINIPLDEMRGFSIAEPTLPIVEVNRKDAYAGRLFSLMHEFTHLLLRQSGICDLDDDADRRPEDQRVEIFCNRVAGAVLVPRDLLMTEPIIAAAPDGPQAWDDETLDALARRFGTSREVVLRRLLICGRTTEAFYRAARIRFLAQYQAQQANQDEHAEESEFRRNMPREAIGHFGPTFVKLVLQNYYERRITLNDVSRHLGVALKHIPAIEQQVR